MRFNKICETGGYLFLFVFLSIVLTSSISHSFEIKKVTEIGPINGSPGYAPIKWSPDGTHIAYFCDGFLMVSDTLGNSHQISRMEYTPKRFEWLSNKEIIVFQKQLQRKLAQSKLILYDLETGEEEELVDHDRRRDILPNEDVGGVEGPYLTLEGNAYYLLYHGKDRLIRLIESKYKQAASLPDNHVYHRHGDELYVVSADYKDSASIYNEIYVSKVFPDTKKYIISKNLLINIRDSSKIDMMPYIGEKPESTLVCGFNWASLNPNKSEALFCISCDNGVDYVVDRVGLFDYIKKELTILDTLVGLKSCIAPKYSPDGRDIALISEGKLYLVVREGE